MLNAVQGVGYGRNAYLSVYASRRVSAQTGAVRPAQPDTPVQAVEPVRSVPKTAAVTEHADYLKRWSSDPVSMAVRSRMEYMDDAALAKLRGEAGTSFAQSAPVKAYAAGAALLPQGMQGTGVADVLLPQGAQSMGAADALLPQGAQGVDAAQALFPQGSRDAGAADALFPQSVLGVNAADALFPQGAKGVGAAGAQSVQGAQGVEEAKSAREVMEEGECQTCKERKYQDGSDDPGVSFKTAQHIAPEMAASEVRGHEMEHVVREQASAAREGRRVVSQSVTYHTAICPECGKAYVSGGTTRTTTAAQNDAFAVTKGKDKEKGGFSGFSAMI